MRCFMQNVYFQALLTREFKDLPNISLMQSELNEVDIQIEGLTLRIKHIEDDIKDSVRICK